MWPGHTGTDGWDILDIVCQCPTIRCHYQTILNPLAGWSMLYLVNMDYVYMPGYVTVTWYHICPKSVPCLTPINTHPFNPHRMTIIDRASGSVLPTLSEYTISIQPSERTKWIFHQCLPAPTTSPINIALTCRLTGEHTYWIFCQCTPYSTPLPAIIRSPISLPIEHTYWILYQCPPSPTPLPQNTR